jgi:predicted metal-binding membrane protein
MISWPSVSLQRRDQLLVKSSLALLVGLAWFYLITLNDNMQNMASMPVGIQPWTPSDFLMMFLMWVIMMIGMMVPSAMRAVLIYSQIVFKARASGRSMAPSSLFISGYVVMWGFFSVAATLLQWRLESLALLSPAMVLTSGFLGTILLIGAGLYQLTPLKDVCLKHCQSPSQFIASNYKKGALGAFQLGLKHGAYCLGCCWVLMGLLFVGGVMNLFWILAISLFILFEKLLPARIRTARVTGILMIASGVFLFLNDALFSTLIS